MRLGLCLLFGLFQTGSADFNQAFATSVLSDIESLVSEPWDRVLNIAYATFNSGGSYLYETRLQDIPTNVNNTQEFVWSLWAPVVGFLDWVYVGFYDGSFYAYSGGTYLYQQNRNNTLYTYWNTTSTIDGKPTGPPSSTSNTYDCTVRPWYTQSEDEGSIWTAPYAFVVGGGGIGITAALRVENKYGEFLGIFAIDYLISNLETILADKVATATNYFLIYIIDNDGLMIAASISGVTSEGTNRIRANESSSDLIRLSAIEIEKYGGNFSAADGILLSIDVPNDGVYFVQASELSEEHGLHWHIIVTELVSCESNNYIPREFDDVLVDTDDTCKECPDNLQCDGEDIYPYPGEGYWMDRDYSKIPKAVYPCVRDTCLGFKQKMKIIYENKKKNNNDDDFTAENYESFADFYDDMIDICWKRGSIDTNDTRCDSDYLMCEKGSQGPLCGTCMDSYTYNSATRKCISCTGNQSVVPAIIIGAILGLIILAIILFVLKDSKLVGGPGLVETEAQTRALVQKFLSIPPFSILKQVDQGMIKVIWATSQIIGTISWNLSIRYPEPFDSLLKVLAYLQLNFFALDCQDSSANFTSRVLFNSFGPLVLSAAIVIGYFIRVALLNNSAKKALDGKDEEKDKEVMESEKQRLMEQHLYFFLLLGFIVLPTVSMLQFTALECTDLADGSSYLRVDTSISCHSSSYKSFLIMDGFLIVIYQSVPLLWFVLLYRIRDKVHPKGAAKHRVMAANRKTVERRSNVTTTDMNAKITQELLSETEKTEVRGRNGDPSIQYVAFLWKDYRPERWYFEVFEMYRRILFIAVIPLLGNESSIRAIVGCLISLIMIGFVREVSPFIRGATNVLLSIAQYQIFITFFAAFIIVTDGLSHLGLSNFALGCLLFVINIVILSLLAMWSLRRYSKELKQKRWRKALNNQELNIINAVMDENKTMFFGSDDERESERSHTVVSRAVEMVDHMIRHHPKEEGGDVEMANKSKSSHRDSTQKKKKRFAQFLLDPDQIKMDKKIGAGAFGEVFKGTYKNDTVAIKTMINVTEKTAKLFKAEIMLTGTLKHPNIVNFIGACWGQELTCLVLEWVAKGTLGDFLDSDSTHVLSWLDPMLKMATEMAQGLDYLHSIADPNDVDENNVEKHCILHRDMKPDNVLITEFLSCKITDFGTSRAKDTNADATMSAVGTPLYCAPEIMRGEAYDESVDIYSFGLLLLDMCIAKNESLTAFIGEKWRIDHNKKTVPKQPMRFIRAMTEEGWRPIDAKAEDLPNAPKSIIALIMMCFDHEPKNRPTFAQVLEALRGPCQDEIRDGKPFKGFDMIKKVQKESQDESKQTEAISELSDQVKKDFQKSQQPENKVSELSDPVLLDEPIFSQGKGVSI